MNDEARNTCTVTLQFDADDPIARQCATRVVKATEAYLVIHSLVEWMHRKVKEAGYDDEGKKEARTMEEVQERLADLMEEHGITLEDLP